MTAPLRLDHAELLASVRLFKGLDRVALAQLAASVDPVPTADGGAVCRQGESADALYVVSQGSFGVFASAPDRPGETRLGTTRPGDYFGEMALLTGEPRSATVRAEGDGEVLRLDRDHFLDLFRRESSVTRTIIDSYLVAYSATDGRLYSHDQAQRVGIAYAVLTLIGFTLAVPYWRALGLL